MAFEWLVLVSIEFWNLRNCFFTYSIREISPSKIDRFGRIRWEQKLSSNKLRLVSADLHLEVFFWLTSILLSTTFIRNVQDLLNLLALSKHIFIWYRLNSLVQVIFYCLLILKNRTFYLARLHLWSLFSRFILSEIMHII